MNTHKRKIKRRNKLTTLFNHPREGKKTLKPKINASTLNIIETHLDEEYSIFKKAFMGKMKKTLRKTRKNRILELTEKTRDFSKTFSVSSFKKKSKKKSTIKLKANCTPVFNKKIKVNLQKYIFSKKNLKTKSGRKFPNRKIQPKKSKIRNSEQKISKFNPRFKTHIQDRTSMKREDKIENKFRELYKLLNKSKSYKIDLTNSIVSQNEGPGKESINMKKHGLIGVKIQHSHKNSLGMFFEQENSRISESGRKNNRYQNSKNPLEDQIAESVEYQKDLEFERLFKKNLEKSIKLSEDRK